MRHQYMRRKAAIGGDAEMMMRGAQILLTGAASGAFPAADPRVDRHAAANSRAAGSLSRGFDHAGDLVPKCERQRAVLGNVEPLVAAQREIPILQMQVGMAHAAALNAHENLAAARGRAIRHRLTERLAISDKRLTAKFTH